MTIYFTVTNDLNYDQRMERICNSIAGAGYTAVLVGRKMPGSKPLRTSLYQQVRLNCWFRKGKLFYAEFNLRLFFFLLFKKMDGICAIDLDTILPCLFVSRIKKIPRIYDAHELFCEMKEIVTRPAIYKMWKRVERYAVPQFLHGYTVNEPIAEEFKKMYGVDYAVIRNIAVYRDNSMPERKEKFILYQGAVNEGRSFETLIPAMAMVNCRLLIYGDGNFMEQAKQLVADHNLQDKVIFKGKVEPNELRAVTQKAYIGVTLFENKGLSNYFSLGNRFFDYMHAGLPQVCVKYPVYEKINSQYHFAVLTDDISAANLANVINDLLQDDKKYNLLKQNCLIARQQLNWQQEEKKLIHFYTKIFG